MHLAIGDVVRDRGDMALATVAGLATNAEGNLVALRLSGGGVRLTAPYDLDLVARYSHPPTTARMARTVIALLVAVAVVAAGIGWQSAQESGVEWPMAFLTGLGSYTVGRIAFQSLLRLTGPRRFRV
ncbi:hypothetical protein OG369_16205 [Streptomyces sp. NBC_01221]|uniref:hypothetical protein n=1 Tax=Streptomyces sp. NBC_01221 TaxID=2903782 RepID=UPI00225407BB|nr:hypothetical protein [Streptomyces sp. NBC_01221]MCX4787672.1 hypothetical protein [Streptomyces sp. NBC_01221]